MNASQRKKTDVFLGKKLSNFHENFYFYFELLLFLADDIELKTNSVYIPRSFHTEAKQRFANTSD